MSSGSGSITLSGGLAAAEIDSGGFGSYPGSTLNLNKFRIMFSYFLFT